MQMSSRPTKFANRKLEKHGVLRTRPTHLRSEKHFL